MKALKSGKFDPVYVTLIVYIIKLQKKVKTRIACSC